MTKDLAAQAPQLPEAEDYRAALAEMAEAYSEAFFSPLSAEQLKKLVKAMGHNTAVAAPSDRLHASWGRHLVATIERKAEQFRVERSDTPPKDDTTCQWTGCTSEITNDPMGTHCNAHVEEIAARKQGMD